MNKNALCQNIYKGDVLEHALNFGIESSSKRFEMTLEEVALIVKKFQKEIQDAPECDCESHGFTKPCMWFQCTKYRLGYRIMI